MKVLKALGVGLLFLLIFAFVLGLYLIGGWVVSLLLNPILANFGLNTITPVIGAFIIVLCEMLGKLIRK
ncbi:TPA: hypothetical protein KOX39_003440 [Clostridioides difficile]|nr:hypothetical protein [Clostridioides difficile]